MVGGWVRQGVQQLLDTEATEMRGAAGAQHMTGAASLTWQVDFYSSLIQQLLNGTDRSVSADMTAAGVAACMSMAAQLMVMLHVLT
jgi:hypothetical protein